jgi:hypothetical protein
MGVYVRMRVRGYLLRVISEVDSGFGSKAVVVLEVNIVVKKSHTLFHMHFGVRGQTKLLTANFLIGICDYARNVLEGESARHIKRGGDFKNLFRLRVDDDLARVRDNDGLVSRLVDYGSA